MSTQVDMVLGTANDSAGGGFTAWATGVYIVSLVAVSDAGKSRFPLKKNDGELITDEQGNPIYPDQLRWEFRFDEVDSKRTTETQDACIGEVLYRWTSKSFGIGPGGPSKARGYYEALLGRRMADGEAARVGAVLQQQARATLKAENGRVTGFDLTPIDEMVEAV